MLKVLRTAYHPWQEQVSSQVNSASQWSYQGPACRIIEALGCPPVVLTEANRGSCSFLLLKEWGKGKEDGVAAVAVTAGTAAFEKPI